MKFIKLLKDVKVDTNNTFRKGSVIQLLTKASISDPSIEVIAVDAYDEQNLPYVNGNEIFTLSNFNEKEHQQIKPRRVKSIEFSTPGSVLDDNDDSVTLALKEAFNDKTFQADINGNVSKKAELAKKAEEMNNNLTADEDASTTDFDMTVEGEDDPGITDNYTEDTSTKPIYQPFSGQLARKKKAKSPDNHLNDTDDSIDYSMNTDGEDDPGITDNYTQDTSTKVPTKPVLGPLARLRKKMAEIGDQLDAIIPSDGDQGGDNLSDYEIDVQVDNDGQNDEFRLKEAIRNAKVKISNLKKKIRSIQDEDGKTIKFKALIAPFNGGKEFEEDFIITEEDIEEAVNDGIPKDEVIDYFKQDYIDGWEQRLHKAILL